MATEQGSRSGARSRAGVGAAVLALAAAAVASAAAWRFAPAAAALAAALAAAVRIAGGLLAAALLRDAVERVGELLHYRGRLAPLAPGLVRWPLVRQLPGVLPIINRLHDHCLRWAQLTQQRARGGARTYRILMPSPLLRWAPAESEFVHISDPACVRHVLKDAFHVYGKGAGFREHFHDFLGSGIFNADHVGAAMRGWRMQRKVAAYEFSVARFRHFAAGEIAGRARGLAHAVARAVARAEGEQASPGEGGAGHRCVVDVQDLAQRYTLDAICGIAFGVNVDSLGDASVKFARDFDRISQLICERFSTPHWRAMRAAGVGTEGELRAALTRVDAFCYAIIRQREAQPIEEIDLQADLLSRFMVAQRAAEAEAMGDGGSSGSDGNSATNSAYDQRLASAVRVTAAAGAQPKSAVPHCAASAAPGAQSGARGSSDAENLSDRPLPNAAPPPPAHERAGGGAGCPFAFVSGVDGAGAPSGCDTPASSGSGEPVGTSPRDARGESVGSCLLDPPPDFRRGQASSRHQFLRDVVTNFVIAGRDTTANALTWALWELSEAPAAAARVREEARRELGRAHADIDDTGGVSYDALKRMPYTHACVLEALRLHPSVPQDLKQAARDDVLPDGTLVRKGSYVSYDPYVMGRLQELWEDPLEFKPERFLRVTDEQTGALAVVTPDLYKFTAFQAGPRRCLGMELALLEAKAAIGTLLREWELEPDEAVALEGRRDAAEGANARARVRAHEPPYKYALTLPAEGGMRMRVRPVQA